MLNPNGDWTRWQVPALMEELKANARAEGLWNLFLSDAKVGAGMTTAQGRLGPGRIHHCMRDIGAAERALELMIERGLSRTAFGKPLLDLVGIHERIANARIAIDQARLLTL